MDCSLTLEIIVARACSLESIEVVTLGSIVVRSLESIEAVTLELIVRSLESIEAVTLGLIVCIRSLESIVV